MKTRLVNISEYLKRRLFLQKNNHHLLIYCGLYKGKSFNVIYRSFDLSIGFEPIPELFDELQLKYSRDPRVTLVNAALASEDHNAKFYIYDIAPASSLSTVGSEYKERVNRNFNVDQIIEVDCINLGEWIHRHSINEIDTLITDLQGYDLCVLKTCSDLIRNHKIRIIHCEVERDNIPPVYVDSPSNKFSDFQEFLGSDYEILKIDGEPHHNFDDVTWIRRGESDLWCCI